MKSSVGSVQRHVLPMDPVLKHQDVEKILSLINCQLCNGYSDRTIKILPCHDSFCEDCLQRHCNEKKKGKRAPCPVCGEMFKIPHGGCVGLRTNEFAQVAKSVIATQGENLSKNLKNNGQISKQRMLHQQLDVNVYSEALQIFKDNMKPLIQLFVFLILLLIYLLHELRDFFIKRENVCGSIGRCVSESHETIGDLLEHLLAKVYPDIEKKFHLAPVSDSTNSKPCRNQNASTGGYGLLPDEQVIHCENAAECSYGLDALHRREASGNDKSKTKNCKKLSGRDEGTDYLKSPQKLEVSFDKIDYDWNDFLPEGNDSDDKKVCMKEGLMKASEFNEEKHIWNVLLGENATDDDKHCMLTTNCTDDRKKGGFLEYEDGMCSSSYAVDDLSGKWKAGGTFVDDCILIAKKESNVSISYEAGFSLIQYGGGNQTSNSNGQPSATGETIASSDAGCNVSSSIPSPQGRKSSGDGGEDDDEKRDKKRYFSNKKNDKKQNRKMKKENDGHATAEDDQEKDKEEEDDKAQAGRMTTAGAAAADDDVKSETVLFVMPISNDTTDLIMCNQTDLISDDQVFNDVMGEEPNELPINEELSMLTAASLCENEFDSQMPVEYRDEHVLLGVGIGSSRMRRPFADEARAFSHQERTNNQDTGVFDDKKRNGNHLTDLTNKELLQHNESLKLSDQVSYDHNFDDSRTGKYRRGKEPGKGSGTVQGRSEGSLQRSFCQTNGNTDSGMVCTGGLENSLDDVTNYSTMSGCSTVKQTTTPEEETREKHDLTSRGTSNLKSCRSNTEEEKHGQNPMNRNVPQNDVTKAKHDIGGRHKVTSNHGYKCDPVKDLNKEKEKHDRPCSPNGKVVNKRTMETRQDNRHHDVTARQNEHEQGVYNTEQETDVKQLRRPTMGTAVQESAGLRRVEESDIGTEHSAGDGSGTSRNERISVGGLNGRQVTTETRNLNVTNPVLELNGNHFVHSSSSPAPRGHEINIDTENPFPIANTLPSTCDIGVVTVTDTVLYNDPCADENSWEANVFFCDHYPIQVSHPQLTLETYNTSALRLTEEAFQRIIANAVSNLGDPIESMTVSVNDDVVVESMEINVLHFDI